VEDKIIVQKQECLNLKDITHLVDESINEGFRHMKRLFDDYENGTNRFNNQGEALLTAIHNNRIIGVCGLNQDPYSSDDLGRVRRMYVSQDYRRQGIAKLMMDVILKEARKHYQVIVLKTDNPVAEKFYLSLGFAIDTSNDKVSHYLELS
jgi:GNAT superfamily N-acetyltransferase